MVTKWVHLLCFLQPEKSHKVVLLIVPTEMGQPTHSQHVSGHDAKHGHGAFVRSISQLCLKHASNHRTKVMSKWKVNKPHPAFSGFIRPRLNSCPCVAPRSMLPPSPHGGSRQRRQTLGANPILEDEEMEGEKWPTPWEGEQWYTPNCCPRSVPETVCVWPYSIRVFCVLSVCDVSILKSGVVFQNHG